MIKRGIICTTWWTRNITPRWKSKTATADHDMAFEMSVTLTAIIMWHFIKYSAVTMVTLGLSGALKNKGLHAVKSTFIDESLNVELHGIMPHMRVGRWVSVWKIILSALVLLDSNFCQQTLTDWNFLGVKFPDDVGKRLRPRGNSLTSFDQSTTFRRQFLEDDVGNSHKISQLPKSCNKGKICRTFEIIRDPFIRRNRPPRQIHRINTPLGKWHFSSCCR